MLKQHVRMIAAFAVLSLALAACGGDDGGGGADSAVGQALTQELLDDEDGPAELTEEEARCIAGNTVDGVGEDRLAELGVTAETVPDIDEIDFSDEELDTVISAFFDCIDVAQVMADELAGEFGQETANCLAGAFDEDVLRNLFTSAFTGEQPGDDLFQVMLDAMAECDVPLGG